MQNRILFSFLLFTSLSSFAQKQLTKQRQQNLSAYRAAANRDGKTIMLFSSASKSNSEKEISYMAGLENKQVYRVNLDSLNSKYSSEAEKGLEQLFTRAQEKNWILFFDEADGLFGRAVNDDAIISDIEKLSRIHKVKAFFWCEEDCLKRFPKLRYTLVTSS